MFIIYAFSSCIFKHLLVPDVLNFCFADFFNVLFLETCFRVWIVSRASKLFCTSSSTRPFYATWLFHSEEEEEEGMKTEREEKVVSHASSLLFHILIPSSSPSSLSPPLFFCRCLFFVVFSPWDVSVPQFEETVPGSCADAHPVFGDAGAAHPVVVAGENAWRREMKRW